MCFAGLKIACTALYNMPAAARRKRGQEKMLEDNKLIWRLGRGDKQAMREIYMKYKDSMYTTATALLNDYAAAEDVLHDVFTAFAKDAPGFGLYRSIKNYLAARIIDRSAQILQSKMYKVVEVQRDRNRLLQDADSGNTASEQQRTASEMEAMMKVPLPQRQAVALHLHGGLSLREIAQVQQVSVNTAEARYRYGLEKLASILDRQVET
jgi:RNA polymerase sigma factor (sigma-70 family)